MILPILYYKNKESYSFYFFMLTKLFGSKIRVKILQLTVNNPNERHNAKSLARRIKTPVNSVRKELENLEKFGLLKSGIITSDEEKQALGQDGVFTATLRPLPVVWSGNAPELIADFFAPVAVIEPREGISLTKLNKSDKKYYQANLEFALYNEIKDLLAKSHALHDKRIAAKLQKVGSLKILVLTGFFVGSKNSSVDLLIVGNFPKNKPAKVIKEIEKEIGREINYTLMTPREFKYRRDMTDVFLYNLLDGKKIVAVDEIGGI